MRGMYLTLFTDYYGRSTLQRRLSAMDSWCGMKKQSRPSISVVDMVRLSFIQKWVMRRAHSSDPTKLIMFKTTYAYCA